VSWYVELGLQNNFEFADAYTWGSGRGPRYGFGWEDCSKMNREHLVEDERQR